jgi:hypothetical protein
VAILAACVATHPPIPPSGNSRPVVQALVQGEPFDVATRAILATYGHQPRSSQAECRRFDSGHPL